MVCRWRVIVLTQTDAMWIQGWNWALETLRYCCQDLTAFFKTCICKDINYPNPINFQLLLLLALASSETWTRLDMLARVRMRQTSWEFENGLHFWANVDNLKLYYIVWLVKTREVPCTTLGNWEQKVVCSYFLDECMCKIILVDSRFKQIWLKTCAS